MHKENKKNKKRSHINDPSLLTSLSLVFSGYLHCSGRSAHYQTTMTTHSSRKQREMMMKREEEKLTKKKEKADEKRKEEETKMTQGKVEE